MKITAVETVPIAVGLDRRATPKDTKGFRFTSHLVILLLHTDSGQVGLGEVTGSPNWSGELQQGAKALIDQYVAPLLIGEDPRELRALLRRLEKPIWGNPFAKAAVEMALWDLVGKAAGMPLYQLLGGAVRPREIPIRFAVMPLGPEESCRVARQMVGEGCRTIKLKVGHDTIESDLARIAAVRDAVGPDIRITVDANGGWTVNEAIRGIHRMEAYDIAVVEQPVHRLDLDGMARVRSQVRLPIMADESVFTVQDALACLQKGAADIISLYPGKNGSILNVMTIAGMAEAAGVHCALGSNMEWDIASAAMAHCCASLPNIQVERYGADLLGPLYHKEHALTVPLTYNPGCFTVPDGPGLGVAIDMERLAQLREPS